MHLPSANTHRTTCTVSWLDETLLSASTAKTVDLDNWKGPPGFFASGGIVWRGVANAGRTVHQSNYVVIVFTPPFFAA